MKKIGIAFFSALFLFACSSSDDVSNPDKPDDPNTGIEEPLEVHTVLTDATSFSSWTYYSIEKGGPVEVADPKNSLAWDIAFHRYDVRLNGGKSGKGKGGAVEMDEKELAKIEVAPTEGYVEDTDGQITIGYTTGNPQIATASFNKELYWINFTSTITGPRYTFLDKAFVIKTASGKYAKVKFLSYIDSAGRKGKVTWQYAYQKNGTTDLK